MHVRIVGLGYNCKPGDGLYVMLSGILGLVEPKSEVFISFAIFNIFIIHFQKLS